MSGQALEQFNEIMADPVGVLSRMIHDKQPETEFLEFKGGKIAKNIEHAKTYFSETLSAFANTSGGVLIFGLDSRPDPLTKIDGATEKVFVDNAEEFRNQLWARRLQATTDAIIGLRIEAIKEQDGGGYVVCYVPEGTVKPYRAEFADSKYYMRNGDSNAVIPHAVLRAMFYPQSLPKLTCTFKYWKGYDDHYQAAISLVNTGTATADDLYIRCFVSNTEDVQLNAIAPLNFREGTVTSSRGIHPGEQVELVANARPSRIRECICELTIYCRNTPVTMQRLHIPNHLRFYTTVESLSFEEVPVEH